MKRKENISTLIGRGIVRILLILWSLTIVFPLLWVFYTSFKTNKEFYANVWALPENWRVENYEFAWNTANFAAYFKNSLFTVVVTLVLTLLMTTTTAYILAKFKYRWLGVVRGFYTVVLAIPGVLILVPQYFMFLRMHMTDSLWALAMLYALNSVPFTVFMQMGFMRSINDSLLEAASLDGASQFQTFSGSSFRV